VKIPNHQSGIHYDALALAPSLTTPAGPFDTTIFPSPPTPELLGQVTSIADEWKKKRKYTDLATFTLQCKICGTNIKGESEAKQHASQTGHVDFGEYGE